MHDLTVGCNQDRADQVVAGQPVRSGEPTDAAAERETADAGVSDSPPRHGQPMRLGGRVEVAPEGAASGTCGSPIGVDLDAAQGREIDYEAALAGGESRRTMSAAADSDRELATARKGHRLDDVLGTGAASDHGWAPVDVAVPDSSRFLVNRDRQASAPYPALTAGGRSRRGR
jgi:hypothetical protein